MAMTDIQLALDKSHVGVDKSDVSPRGDTHSPGLDLAVGPALMCRRIATTELLL